MRSAAPLILKMSFKSTLSSNKNQRQLIINKNIAHLKYIGTRDGAEINNKELFKQPLQETKNEEEIIKNYLISDDQDYVNYIDERPGSHGLFNAWGGADIKQTAGKLENHDGIVWRGIVSLHGDDAERLDYTNQETWAGLMKANMNGIAKDMGLKVGNIDWVAAYHHEEGHPHVHFMLWEKTPEKSRGVVSQKTIEKIKQRLVKDVFHEDRLAIFKEKTATRTAILDMAKDEMISEKEFIKEVNKARKEQEYYRNTNRESKTSSFSPKLYKDDASELTQKMVALAKDMKNQGGRAAYAFLKPELKEQVDNIVETLINKPQFIEHLMEIDKQNETIVRHYSEKANDIRQMQEREREEMKHRIANVVVKAAKLSQNNYYIKLSDKKINKFVNRVEIEGKSIEIESNLNGKEARAKVNKTIKTLTKTCLLSGKSMVETRDLIKDKLQRNTEDNEKIEENIEKITEQVSKELKDAREWKEDITISRKDFFEMAESLDLKDSDYIFESDIEKSFTAELTNSVWKEVFKIIDQEVKRSSAEAEMQQRRASKRYAREQSQGREREYGE